MDFKRLGEQFTKYAIVGIANFGISWGVVNLLMFITHIYQGLFLILFAAIGFVCAVSNSYLWNRNWAFKSQKGGASTYSLFFILTLIGAIIGMGIFEFIATYIPPIKGLSRQLWANFALLVSVAFQVIWNFTVYSQVVFKAPISKTAEMVASSSSSN